MLSHLHDPSFPTLHLLGQNDIVRITGAAEPRLLRARHQPGGRALLHVALGTQPGCAEGAIWFYAGTKANKLASRLVHARFDSPSAALFQAFPHDHRIPLLATFIESAPVYARKLLGGPASRSPELLRYRPGLSATFRWVRDDGRAFFVRQTPGDGASQQAVIADGLSKATRELPELAFAPVVGLIPEMGLIAYAAAEGRSLERIIPGAGMAATRRYIAQVTDAMLAMSSVPVTPLRVLDRKVLLEQAEENCRMINRVNPAAGRYAAELLTTLEQQNVSMRRLPIHGDMKLEHAFLFGSQTTLIDMENLSLGDPNLDLANMEVRVTVAELNDRLSTIEAEVIRTEIRRAGSGDFDWFKTYARLQSARFCALSFDPSAPRIMRRLLQSD